MLSKGTIHKEELLSTNNGSTHDIKRDNASENDVVFLVLGLRM